MKGYWSKSRASEETLRSGWLHTGNPAGMDNDGYLYRAGRKKDMIIPGAAFLSLPEGACVKFQSVIRE